MCTHVSHDVTRVPTNGVTCHSWGVYGRPLHPVHHIISLPNCGTFPPPYNTTVIFIHHQSQLSLLHPHALHTVRSVHRRSGTKSPPGYHSSQAPPYTTIQIMRARPATNSTSNAAAYTKHHITVIKPYTTSQYTT